MHSSFLWPSVGPLGDHPGSWEAWHPGGMPGRPLVSPGLPCAILECHVSLSPEPMTSVTADGLGDVL